MIEFLSGLVDDLTPTAVVIDCHGVGYEVNISLIDYSELQGKREAKLYIHESIREDAHVLFGFLSRRARELFRLLIGVSGVGPNTARLILSSLTVSALESAICSGSEAALKSVKGIGGKTAQRILVDLKDKIKVTDSTLISSEPVSAESYEDALSALIMLGFTSAASQKVLKKVYASEPSASTEKAIKLALSML